MRTIAKPKAGEYRVRALGYHIAGHEAHHVHIIKERYLGIPG